MVWTGSVCLRISTDGERSNELSVSVNCREVLEWLQNWRPLEKGSTPWNYVSVTVVDLYCALYSFETENN
jgi:hypothetical protein